MSSRPFVRVPSAVVLLVLALVLASCVRAEVATTVAEDGSGELVMTLFIDAELVALIEEEEGEEFDFSEWDAGFPASAVLSDVTDGTDIGRQALMTFATLDELRELTLASGLVAAPAAEPVDGQFRSFEVRRDGSVFIFDAVYPEYPVEGDDSVGTTVEVALTLPGTVFDDNADEVDGERLIWRFDAEGPAQLQARSQTVLIAGLVDVAGTTHEAAIAWVAEAGITTGFSDNTFRPGDDVTRGQMAAFLFRALELAPGTASFDDTIGTTHEAAIAAVAAAGITTGFPDDTFRPGDPVTRGQMAAFLFRGLDLAPGTASFDDTIGTTHEAAIAAVAAAGITTGFPDDTFRPGDDVTRGQMAAFLFRALAE